MESKLEEFINSPLKALITISFPVIIASVVQTFYNIVDTLYVGHIGSIALAAITVAWPFFSILVAISMGLNSGISSRISRYLGEKRKKQAENTAMHGIIMAFFISFVLIIVGIPSISWLLTIGGAEGDVLSMANGYLFYILIGSLFMFALFAINAVFSSQGNTKIPMKIDISSLVLNIILTPIFIFYFGMGIRGAAISTAIAMFLALLLAIYYLRKDSYLKIDPNCFRFSWQIVREIVNVGLPSTIMIFVMSIYVIFLNRAMGHFSVDHLAAFGIVSRLESVSVLPVLGLSVGTLTLVGMFFGAKKYKLMRRISSYAIITGLISTAVTGILFFIFASPLMRAFTSESNVIQLGIPYLRIDVLTFPAMAIMIIFSRIMQGLGRGLPGLIINFVRVFLIVVPLSYIAVFLLGYSYLSIAWSMVIGGGIIILVCILWLNHQMNIFSKEG